MITDAVDYLKNLGSVRLSMFGLTGVVILALIVFAMIRLNEADYAVLYSNLEDKDAAQVLEQLGAQSIPYKLEKDGREILVPSNLVAVTRINLAKEGLPKGGNFGYELFDEESGLGGTNSQQMLKRKRALEGELARTISKVDGIGAARVHLVLPNRELFSRTSENPSASVFLQTSGDIASNTVLAIRHLVASAVPKLSSKSVAVIDGSGQLLAGAEEGSDPLMDLTKSEMLQQHEKRLVKTIENILQQIVGVGSVRAKVSLKMNFDRFETMSETYDPDGQVAASTQIVTEEDESTEAEAIDTITVANQLPTADAGKVNPLFPTARTTAKRTEETRNFKSSRTTVRRIKEAPIVERLTASVIVDGTYEYNEDNEITAYNPRSQEEMSQLTALVQTAVGYDLERGDTVNVINMRFSQSEYIEPEVTTLFGLPRADLFRIAEVFMVGVIAIFSIILVIRPLLAKAFEEREEFDEGVDDLFESELARLPSASDIVGSGSEDDSEDAESMIDVSRIEGGLKNTTLNRIGELVEKYPEEAVNVLRQWMYVNTG